MHRSGSAEVQDDQQSPQDPAFPVILERCLAAGVIGIDAKERIITCSAVTAQLLALGTEELLGQPAEILPPPLVDILIRTRREKRPLPDHHLLLPGLDGARLLVRASTEPLSGTDGSCIGALAILNDVTSARHLEQNIRRLDRLASIGTLSASMAHEVKNAMVAVKTFVDLLIKQNQDAALADIVAREMRRIDSIVSQMLRCAGPARPSPGEVHLHKVLEESLSLVQHHLEGRKIQLLRDFQADPDTINGDVYQLQQAFLNLFFNAIEAMGANGELRVSTGIVPAGGPENPHDACLRVTVRDSGIGIAPENLQRLFDPFFTTKPEGTGLGLPITRRIIQEHRGVITVASELHQGTTFTLLLPSTARQP